MSYDYITDQKLTTRVEQDFDFSGREGEQPRWRVLVVKGGSNYLEGIQVSIGDREKAERFAAFIEAELGPEFAEENRIRAIRYARTDQISEARHRIRTIKQAAADAARDAKISAGQGEPTEYTVCPECGHEDDDAEFDEPVYECGQCGTEGRGADGRRCTQCHRFAAKMADRSCPSCEQMVEETETVSGLLVDGVFVRTAAGEETA